MRFVALLGLALWGAFSTTTGFASTHKPLANVVRCVVSTDQCRKFPVWRATHPEVSHWTRTVTKHGQAVTWQYPILKRKIVTPAPQHIVGTYSLHTTYYCLTGLTASGVLAGPGVVASYVLPWRAHVKDLTTGWEGYVLDHPDALTQADEWLPCGSAFATGTHVWVVLG